MKVAEDEYAFAKITDKGEIVMEPKDLESQTMPEAIPGNLPFPGTPGGKRPGRGKMVVLAVGAVILVFAVVFGILLGTHVICLNHNWQNATCTEPEICAKCGRTQGEALGHDWKKATCISPEACSRCEEARGEALGHDWEEASCLKPKSCSRCQETEGEALGHSGAWKITKTATLNKSGTKENICERCGATLESEAIYKTPEVSKDGFNFGEVEFIEYLGQHTNSSYIFKTDGVSAEEYGMEDGTAYPIYVDGSYKGFILMKSNDLNRVVGIILIMNTEDKDTVSALGLHIMNQLVPDLDNKVSATSLVLKNSYTAGGVTITTGDLNSLYAAILIPEGYTNK